ncbi:Arginyl-tRNA--protein transferase [Lachnellula hyalina]|uniref:Arginyl-tRNA--protein transferase 1 n=1 Tax=Lachnellula hyalina TaxID=1316788 RepID=A0A8H8R7E0_9HELO|nr:Arginyl-tRNA--protein transferase [Lachnellula hyalina]TVY29724.1 Arginyl-tRNA--protein transferase [Lachnellula hyalina]
MDGGARGVFFTSQTKETHAAPNTQFSFRASKDQRQALNRFNKHILGEKYSKEAARLYPLSRDKAKKRNTDFDLVQRVHESESSELKTPPEPEHALRVTLEADDFTEEKYVLFENYQRLVHHEPPGRISKSGFKNFLCSSPLPRSETSFDGKERKVGSYHQCYRIDGKLIAIGVLDLLPQCVSAVYFMYHESVNEFSFGKIGALREVALAKEQGYKWWYAGFYIHNCIKMRYKADYSPQYMLDPESYDWNLLDNGLKNKLSDKKYVSLSREKTIGEVSTDAPGDEMETEKKIDDGLYSDDDPSSLDPDTPLFSRKMPGILTKEQLLTEVDLDHVKLRLRGQEAHTCDLVSWDDGDVEDLASMKGIIGELASAVGPRVAQDMVVSFGG